VEAALEDRRCPQCGRELLALDPDEAPEECEDCRPETGAGSQLVERLSINLRRLRQSKGLDQAGLAERAGLHASDIWQLEGDRARGLRTTKALKLAQALDVSLDHLVEGIFWTPGQVLRNAEGPLPAERLSGFFLVLPANEAAFELGPRRAPVVDRHDAARILGANLRDARERRHLTQHALARASGLGKNGLSLIEQGVNETTVETLLALACSLNLPPGRLLDGIRLEPQPPSSPSCTGRAHRPISAMEGDVLRMWNEDKPAFAIAEVLGVSTGTISSTVHRLRERGKRVPYRRPPTRAAQERARRRRETCTQANEGSGRPPESQPVDASNDEIAAQVGANMALWREEAGLTYRELREATEVDHSHLFRAEKGSAGVPNLTFILKLAGSLNVPASFFTAGVAWNPALESFRVEEPAVVPRIQTACLGLNAVRARYRLDLSQQSLADRAAMSVSDVSAFERWCKNFRLFSLVRMSAALGVTFDELFEGVANWYFRPLPPPEYLPGERPTKRERDQLVIRLWHQGRPELEIAEALDLPRNSISPYIRELRDAGENLPYRRAPRSAAEVTARRRRRDAPWHNAPIGPHG
jgi:transcriptional regulator with XRE-family HTH domain